jgi:hypothetical protein
VPCVFVPPRLAPPPGAMIVAVRALSIDLFCSSMSERLEEFSSLVVHNRPPSVTVVAIIVPRSLKMSTDPQEREPANYRSAVRTSAAQRLSDPRHFQPMPVCESRGKSGMRGIIRDYPVRDRESLEETSKMNHGVDFSESGCTDIVEAMDRSDCRACRLHTHLLLVPVAGTSEAEAETMCTASARVESTRLRGRKRVGRSIQHCMDSRFCEGLEDHLTLDCA